jgi:hypothetical protein
VRENFVQRFHRAHFFVVLKTSIPRHQDRSTTAVATVAGGHFGDVKGLAAQAGGGEAGLYKKDDQP